MQSSFIKEFPNAVPDEQCEGLISYFERKIADGSTFIHDGSSANGDGRNRSDTAIYLNQMNADIAGVVTSAVRSCWEMYVDDFKFLNGVNVISYHLKMQRTLPMGGFHSWHWEHRGDHDYRNRMAVWTLYLTTHEDEGETEFLAHGLKVKPEKGKFCIFPADYTAVHRGNPVYTKPKYIVTGWYEYNGL
jgi:hypothetical protein